MQKISSSYGFKFHFLIIKIILLNDRTTAEKSKDGVRNQSKRYGLTCLRTLAFFAKNLGSNFMLETIKYETIYSK